MKVLAAANARIRTLGAGPDTSPAQAIVVEGGGAGSGIVTDEGAIDFQALADDPAVAVFIAPQPVFPGIRDYAGLIPDEDLSTATTLPARDKRGLLHGYNRRKGQFGFFEELRILGDVVVRSMCRIIGTAPSVSILDFGAGGAGEANNRVFNANFSALEVNFESQSGSAVQSQAFWRLPGRLQSEKEVLVEWRRESNVVTTFVNGLQLRRSYTLTNATAGVDGAVTFLAPTGGTTGTFCTDDFAVNVGVDAYFGAVENALTGPSPAIYAVGKRTWSAAELGWIAPTDYAALGAAGNVVLCLQPTANGLEDTAGTVDYTTDWTTEIGGQSLAIGDAYYTDGAVPTNPSEVAVYKADLDIVTSMSVQMRWMAQSSSAAGLVKCDTTTGANHAWLFALEGSSNQVRFFHRDGGGNRDVAFTIGALSTHEIREWHVKRTVTGGSSTIECWERKAYEETWTKLTVKSTVGGSGVGTDVGTISGPNPSSGPRLFHFYDRSPMIKLIVYNEAVDP